MRHKSTVSVIKSEGSGAESVSSPIHNRAAIDYSCAFRWLLLNKKKVQGGFQILDLYNVPEDFSQDFFNL